MKTAKPILLFKSGFVQGRGRDKETGNLPRICCIQISHTAATPYNAPLCKIVTREYDHIKMIFTTDQAG